MNVEPPETLMILEAIVYKSNGFAIETVSRASKLVGAGETIATGSANKFAIYGFGSVGANAFAIGENTSTLANTDTKVYVSPYLYCFY